MENTRDENTKDLQALNETKIRARDGMMQIQNRLFSFVFLYPSSSETEVAIEDQHRTNFHQCAHSIDTVEIKSITMIVPSSRYLVGWWKGTPSRPLFQIESG